MAKRRRSREFKSNQVIDIELARKERRERRKLAAAQKQQKENQALKQQPSRRRMIKNLRRRFIYGAVFVIIAFIMAASVYNVISLKMEEAAAKEHLSALEEQKKELEEELSVVDSKEYIEQQAREQLRMISPGEILYVLKERDKTKDETED